jgi:outer membrane protein W
MKMAKKYIIVLIMLSTGMVATGQDNYLYFAWNYQLPTSNTAWLDSGSPHGGKLGYRFFVKDNRLSLGVDLNWITFDQYEETRTFQVENGAITTDYFKYIYQYAAVVSAQYYFPVKESKIFFPYAGLGLGANYNDFTLYYNIYDESYPGWGFLARPEAGVVVRFGPYRSLGAIAGVHYDYSTNKNEQFNYSNFSSVGFKLGIVVMSR